MDRYTQIAREICGGKYQTISANRKSLYGYPFDHFRICKWHGSTCGCFVVFVGNQHWFDVNRIVLHQGGVLQHDLPVVEADGLTFMATNLRDLDVHPDVFDMLLERRFCTHLFPGGTEKRFS